MPVSDGRRVRSNLDAEYNEIVRQIADGTISPDAEFVLLLTKCAQRFLRLAEDCEKHMNIRQDEERRAALEKEHRELLAAEEKASEAVKATAAKAEAAKADLDKAREARRRFVGDPQRLSYQLAFNEAEHAYNDAAAIASTAAEDYRKLRRTREAVEVELAGMKARTANPAA